ncbi:hypothetical protein BASA81_005009 [Batrachochytrium salamandrivorans]|nr:hypothetical protein BASA81_005009 [Batrachochytrium salamandrivorans]
MTTTLDEYRQLANMSLRGACPRCNGFGFFHTAIDKHDRPTTQRCKKCIDCSVCDGSGVTVGVIGCKKCQGRGFSHSPRAARLHTLPDQMRCFDCEECKECKGDGVIDPKRFQELRRASLSTKQIPSAQIHAMASTTSLNSTSVAIASSGVNTPIGSMGGTTHSVNSTGISSQGSFQNSHSNRSSVYNTQSDSLSLPPMVPDLSLLGPLGTNHLAVIPNMIHPHMAGIFGVPIDQTIFDAMMSASMILSENVPLSIQGGSTVGVSAATRKALLADQTSGPCPRCDGNGFRHDSSAKHDTKKKQEKCKHCTPCKACSSSGRITGQKACDTCATKGFIHGATERDHDVPPHLRCFFCKDCPTCRGVGLVKIGASNAPAASGQHVRAMLRRPEDRISHIRDSQIRSGMFVGLKVRIQMPDSMTVEGIVSAVEPTTHRLSLTQVTLFIYGIQQQHPQYSVLGKDILSLEIVDQQQSIQQTRFPVHRQSHSSIPEEQSSPTQEKPQGPLLAKFSERQDSNESISDKQQPKQQLKRQPSIIKIPSQLIPPHLLQYQPSTIPDPSTKIHPRFTPSENSQASVNKPRRISADILSTTLSNMSSGSGSKSIQESNDSCQASSPFTHLQHRHSFHHIGHNSPLHRQEQPNQKTQTWHTLSPDAIKQESHLTGQQQQHGISLDHTQQLHDDRLLGQTHQQNASSKGDSTAFGMNLTDLSKDFNFEASLSQFDKSRLFAEMKIRDTASPETRLVGHHRWQSGKYVSGDGTGVYPFEASSADKNAFKNKPTKMALNRESVLDAELQDEAGNDAEYEESGLESDAAEVFIQRPASQGGTGIHTHPGQRLSTDPYEPVYAEAVDTNYTGGYNRTTGMQGGGPGLGRISQLLAEPSSPRILRDGMADSPGGKRIHFETISGIYVPTATPLEMMDIERIAVGETGPNDEQMVENGGRGAAMIVMQALGGDRRMSTRNHNSKPFVVVLAGNNKTGAYGIAAARHLANHECRVLVCSATHDVDLVNMIAFQQKIFLPTGGSIIKSPDHLPSLSEDLVDIIIDALLGSHQTLLDIPIEQDRQAIVQMIQWANISKSTSAHTSPTASYPPILSIDMPSGINAALGYPTSPSYFIRPKWTVAMGLAKTGHLRSREYHGDLFLADIGIPRTVIQRIPKLGGNVMLRNSINRRAGKGGIKNGGGGIKRYSPPFGDKYLVGLVCVENGSTLGDGDD